MAIFYKRKLFVATSSHVMIQRCQKASNRLTGYDSLFLTIRQDPGPLKAYIGIFNRK
jgi:hypothetical protein